MTTQKSQSKKILLFALSIGVIGLFLVLITRAATKAIVADVDAPNNRVVSDNTAAGDSFVQFGPVTTTGDGGGKVVASPIRNTKLDNQPYQTTPSSALSFQALTQPRHKSLIQPELNKQIGTFRVDCFFSHLGYVDPIVSPGQENAAHLHTFWGNTRTNASSTTDSLLNNGSGSCDGFALNRSGYWAPTAFDAQGNARIPSWVRIYYKSHGGANTIKDTRPYVTGLRMIAGNAAATSPQNLALIAHWKCGDEGAAKNATIPKCNPNERLIAHVKFPYCWNGKDLDSPNHQSHMAYPTDGNFFSGKCPSTHPIKFPAIEFIINWGKHDGNTDKWFISSDVRPDGSIGPRGLTLHADWWNGWNEDAFETITKQCTQVVIDCRTSVVGTTGRSLKLQQESGTAYAGINAEIIIPRAEIQSKLCPNHKFDKISDIAFCRP